MVREFHAHGKLLLTSEYIVIDGAEALAVPTRLGQRMKVSECATDHLIWEAFDHRGERWLYLKASPNTQIIYEQEGPIDPLLRILREALTILRKRRLPAVKVETHLEFPNEWGWGSSSTLIALIAQWLNIPALHLHFKSTNGSGYDVAAAMCNSALLYKKTGKSSATHQAFDWHPPFLDQLYIIYTGIKQKSDVEVAKYADLAFQRTKVAAQFTELTRQIIQCESPSKFDELIEEHEQILSKVLGRPTIKSALFQDYPGAIKSLGAWGGDFALTRVDSIEDLNYFKLKNFTPILPLGEISLTSI